VREGTAVITTQTTIAPVAAMPVTRSAALTTAAGRRAGVAATAVPAAVNADFLRKAPISAVAGETSVGARIRKPIADVRTRVQAVTGVGIETRLSHVEKYVPGIPPRGRPV
jgi:hypothetical protein